MGDRQWLGIDEGELGSGLTYRIFFYNVVSICLFFESRFLFIYLYLFIYYELACKQMSQIRNTQSACLFISASSKTIDLVVICLSVMTRRKKNHFKSYPFASCLINIRCEYHTADRNRYL